MPKYICKTRCYYRRREWKVGETLDASNGEDVPGHFVPKGTKIVEVEVSEDLDPKTLSEAAKLQAAENEKALGQFNEANVNSDNPPAGKFNFLD